MSFGGSNIQQKKEKGAIDTKLNLSQNSKDMSALVISWFLQKEVMKISSVSSVSSHHSLPLKSFRKRNIWGAFHSTQNSGNSGWFIKWKGPFWFGPTGIFRTSFEGGPQWPVWSFQSVEPKCPFPFAKIVVPSTAFLYFAYKNEYFPMESEVLWVKHDISNSLNQLQFFSIFDICH